MSPADAKRIRDKIAFYIETPNPLSNAKALSKPTDATYRWRIGNYRVLFDYTKEQDRIDILKVQHRREVYRKR